jgi:hypothetical protein
MRSRPVLLVAALLLLGPALLLTTARLVEPDGDLWIQAQAFTPLALVPYGLLFVGLLVALLVALARRRGRSGPLALAGLLALGGLALHGWWFAPQVLGANPPAAGGAERLTVMTANLGQGRGDAVGLVQAASEAGVDVLAVQEITPAALARMRQAGIDELFPHRAGRAEEAYRGTMVFARAPLRAPTRVPASSRSRGAPTRALRYA